MTMAPWEPKRFFASGTWISHLSWEPVKLTLAEAVRMQVVLYHSFVVWYATSEVTGKMFGPEYTSPLVQECVVIDAGSSDRPWRLGRVVAKTGRHPPTL